MFSSSRQAGYSNRQESNRRVRGHAPPGNFETIGFKWLHLVHFRVN